MAFPGHATKQRLCSPLQTCSWPLICPSEKKCVSLHRNLMAGASQVPACELSKGVSLQVCLVQGSADKQLFSIMNACLSA